MNVTDWSPEAHAILVHMAASGARAAEIAKALGLTRNAVIGRARRKGVALTYRRVADPARARKPRTPRPRRERGSGRGYARVYTDEQRAEVRRLYAEGKRYWEIEDATGVPSGYVSSMVRDQPRRRESCHPGRNYKFEERVTAVAARLCGKSHAKVAGALGVCPGSITKWQTQPDVVAAAQIIADRILAEQSARRAQEAATRAAEAALERLRVAAINAPILAVMSPRHRGICQRRVDGETLEAIGTDLGITRERVRQIEAKWRARGLIVPGAKPLSEATLRIVPAGPRPKQPRPPKARKPDGRRRENLDPAIRQARSDRMKAMWAMRQEAHA